MPLERQPFPEFIDSTMRKTFASCPGKYNYEFLHHRNLPSIHLIAGAAFARALEVFRKSFYLHGMGEDDSLHAAILAMIEEWGEYEAPEGAVKTLDAMIGALDYYIKTYRPADDHVQPLRTSDGLAVEFSFAIPLPGTRHPVTGQEILYTGRFDMVGEYAGSLYIVDEKTTTQLGAQWAKQWQLRSQFTGYCWAAQQFGHPVTGAIVRGIAIRKTGYDSAESIVYRPQWFIDRWLEQVIRDVNRATKMWENNKWDFAFDDACSAYGGCLFLDACNSPDPQPWIESLPIHKWNPLDGAPKGDKTLIEILAEGK